MLSILPRQVKKACERPPSAQEARPAGHARLVSFLETELADVGGVGRERHGFEVHGSHAVIGAEDGAEEAAAQVEFHGVGLDGEVLRLAGEIAEDDEDGVGWRDVFRFADHDEDVLVVAVDGEVLAGVDGGVAVMKIDELAVPVEERGGVGFLQCCVGCGVGG